MEKVDPYLTINETQFYVPHLRDWTKERFFTTYKGCSWDLNNGWLRVQERLKHLGLTDNKKYNAKTDRPAKVIKKS